VSFIVLFIVIAGALAWWQPWVQRVEPASLAEMAFPLPEKPSIAVLPFDNLSGDAEQDYLADGLSEEIITILSKVPNLFVIARNSTFTYKGKAVSVKQVAEEQGVRYVLEGSVQRSGDRVRINAQLIDALQGYHLWAERYDREFEDIFALQDDITQKIMIALQVELTEGEEMRYLQTRTGSAEAFTYFQKGRFHFQRFNKEDNAIARQLLTKAAELSPDDPTFWVQAAWTDLFDARFGWSTDREASFRKAEEVAEKAYGLDPDDAKTNGLLGALSLSLGRHEEAIAYARRAVELVPGDASELATLGWILCYSGYPPETIPLLEKAMRLSPYYPPWFAATLGLAYMLTEDYEKAIAAHEHLVERKSMLQFAYSRLAGINAILGNEEKARAYSTELLRVTPEFTIENWSKALLYRDPEDLERELNALRKAGLPESPSLRRPEKPAIAVLSFTNMSGDPEQEYFADGISEDIITDLSQLSNLVVIARNSSFTYKGTSTKVQEIGEDLAVQYVLEGSVRKSGNRVRITAQLVDTGNGHHLWAQRYDRELTDVFALQDDITRQIVNALSVQLSDAEKRNLGRVATSSFEAYDLFLQAQRISAGFTEQGFDQAVSLYREAINLDPGFARAYGALGVALTRQVNRGYSDSPAQARERALALARKAVSVDPQSPHAQWALGFVYLWGKQFNEAVEALQHAIALSPNYADGYALLALVNNNLGQGEDAIRLIKKGMELNPHYSWDYLYNLGRAHYTLGNYDEAVLHLEKAIERNEEVITPRLYLAASYVHLDRQDDAEWEVEQTEMLNPRYTLSYLQKVQPFGDDDLRNRFIDDLRTAGLPE
jgi:TolB-like protein/Tfp pilus assembly protein PilF